jgi:hypothetical protein
VKEGASHATLSITTASSPFPTSSQGVCSPVHHAWRQNDLFCLFLVNSASCLASTAPSVEGWAVMVKEGKAHANVRHKESVASGRQSTPHRTAPIERWWRVWKPRWFTAEWVAATLPGRRVSVGQTARTVSPLQHPNHCRPACLNPNSRVTGPPLVEKRPSIPVCKDH